MELNAGLVRVTFDRREIDPVDVHNYLKTSYWASQRTLGQVKATIASTWVVLGLKYEEKLIGFARVVSDQVVFGLICDVYVLEAYRSRGLGKLIMKEIMNHALVKKLSRITLNTMDANTLYEKFGFMYVDKKINLNGTPTYSMAYTKASDEYYIKYLAEEDYNDVQALLGDVDPALSMLCTDFHRTCFAAKTFNGKLIGLVTGFPSQDCPGEGRIHTMFVHPDWRGRKAARSLYNQLFYTFINSGVRKVRVMLPSEDNELMSFHSHMGFIDTGRGTLRGMIILEKELGV